jgi:hypothetical protein
VRDFVEVNIQSPLLNRKLGDVKGKQGLFVINFHLRNPLPFTARKKKKEKKETVRFT